MFLSLVYFIQQHNLHLPSVSWKGHNFMSLGLNKTSMYIVIKRQITGLMSAFHNGLYVHVKEVSLFFYSIKKLVLD